MVTPLWPRVGIKQIGAVQGFAWQRFDHRSGVAIVEAHIAQLTCFDERQGLGDAVQKGLAAEIANIRMRICLGGEMLAAAKANFEPKRGGSIGK